jgi:RNA-directed DNA polymerase
MTVEQHATGAVSHPDMGWHSIDWQQAHEAVRRLQARIVKATQAGRWGKVKALQRLLTHSYSAKVLAVKRVTENDGKKTPGVDGVLWNTPQQKWEAVNDLQARGYRPLPLRRLYIPKSSDPTKKRPLGIPTMKDRAMQALYLQALEPVAETTGDPHSYGFRKSRACRDAIEQCFVVLAPRRCAQWVLEGDIQACFDTISHEWLMTNIPMSDKDVLRKWLRAGYMEKGQLFPTEAGTPQGGVISPVLANMALDGLERAIRATNPKTTVRGQRAKINLVRYADDFIITGASRELLENEVKPLVEAFLRERGLQLSPEKTLIMHIDDGFDFLAQNIRKYNGKLLIKPSKRSIQKFIRRVRGIIKNNPHLPTHRLIAILTPIIRGWATYHRHVVSKEIFYSLHHEIIMALVRWAKWRHPNKNGLWRKQRYFKRVGFDNWVFFGVDNGKERHLFNIGTFPIKRHIQIKTNANPFDPVWEEYFEKRLGQQMVESFEGRKQLIRLWKEQNGICPVCQQKITTETGWHNHHIQQRAYGGADTDENRVLLHPNCHRLVHSQHLHVEKPRPRQRALPEA